MAVQLPLEVVGFTKELDKTLQAVSASIDGLNKQIEVLNTNIELVGEGAGFKSTEQQVESLSQQFSVLNTTVLAGVSILAASTIGFQKISQVILGTSNLILAGGRAFEVFGSFTSLAAFKMVTFGDQVKESSRFLAPIGILLRNVGLVAAETTTAFLRFGKILGETRSLAEALHSIGLFRLADAYARTSDAVRRFGSDLLGTAKRTEFFQQGVAGSITRVAAFGTGLTLLGTIMRDSESGLIRFIGTITEFVGLLLGPGSLAFAKFVGVAGDFILTVGNRLVAANLNAAQSFNDADLRAFTFERTINGLREIMGDIVPTTDDWTKSIIALQSATGNTTANLQTASTEIAALGADIGLTADQMQFLLKAAVDFNAFIKGDLVQTTLDLLSGIQGNSQSVQKFGINLGENAVQQKLFAKGITSTVSSLSDQEKVQARLNVVIDKFHKVEGLAIAQGDTLAGTAKLLEGRIKQLNTEYGKGSSIVESFAIGQRLLLNVIDLLPESLVNVTGFFGALGGRIIQVTGLLLKFFFTVTLLLTSLKALNFLLGSTTFQKGFFANLPFINNSVQGLISNLAGTQVQIKSVTQLVVVLGQVFVTQAKNMIGGLLGIHASAVSLSAIIQRLSFLVGNVLGKAFAFLLANPIVAIIAAIAGALIVVAKAFAKIEEETGAVSEAFSAIGDAIGGVVDAIFGTENALGKFVNDIRESFSQIFGFITFQLASTLSGFISLIQGVAGRFLSEEKKLKLTTAQQSLQEFQQRIIAAGGNLNNLGKEGEAAGRKIAGIFSANQFDKLPESLQSLVKQLETLGQTELEKLKIQREQRLAIVTENLNKQKINEEQAAGVRAQIEAAYNREVLELDQKRREQILQAAEKFGATNEIARQKERELILAAYNLGILDKQQFEAAKQQIELEAIRAKNEQLLLTAAQFETAKLAIEQQAAESRIEQVLNNELRLSGIQDEVRLNRLAQEKKILTEILANENLTNSQRIAAEKKLAKTKKDLQREQLQTAASGFADLAVLAESSNKTLFAIGKASAIANATISGFLSIQNALAIQPFFPLGLLLAAGAAARFAANIAAINGTNLARGGIIPAGFDNDTFRANLSSGERVLSVQQNKDFTNFIEKEEAGSDSAILGEIRDALGVNNELMTQMLAKLDAMDGETVVNIGNREIFRELRSGIREGRSLAV